MIALRDIRAYAKRIADQFRPRRIILFGSFAYGTPSADSDVDLLVLFAGDGDGNERALEIRLALGHSGFPLDLLTRTEGEVRRRIAIQDWFLKEITENGKVLYDARKRVDRKGGRRLRAGAARAARPKVSRA